MQHEYACIRTAIHPFTLHTLLHACERTYIPDPVQSHRVHLRYGVLSSVSA